MKLRHSVGLLIFELAKQNIYNNCDDGQHKQCYLLDFIFH